MREPIENRIKQWHKYATRQGIELKRILVHPTDLSAAPEFYEGLPVVTFGDVNYLEPA